MKLQQSQQKCLQTIHGSEILMQIGTENQRLPTKATITNPRYHLGDPLRPKISNTRTVWKCKKWGGGTWYQQSITSVCLLCSCLLPPLVLLPSLAVHLHHQILERILSKK
jgi:hypothetical protein